MVVRRDLGDLRKAYRPYRIEELYGQPRVVKTIKHWFSENSVPQMLLFSGPPGTGKISTAKIIAMRLLCKNWSNGTPCFDCTECRAVFQENRISDFTVYTPLQYKKLDAFVDDFRYGTPKVHYNSDGGKIIAFDEFHVIGLDTQRWLLGQFIKYPNNNYIVCSSNLTEILEDIRKKLSSIEFDKVDDPEIRKFIENVCADLIIDPKCDAVNKIIKGADGSPERALNSMQNKHWLKKLSPIISGEIKCIPGKGRILVVAPHAVPGDENDDLTGIIARKIQQRENCYAIINEKYSKNEVDLNNLDSIDAMPKLNIKADFLDPIRNFKDEIKKQGLEPLIVYIHGIMDENILKWGNEDTKILIGYGRGKKGDEKRPHSPTLSDPEIESIKEALSHYDLGGVLAPVESEYCARKEYNLNQLFQQDRYQGYYDQTVKSVQLEIRKYGMREDPIQAAEAGINIGMALRIFFKNLEREQPKTAPQIQGTKIESVKRVEGQPPKNEETKPQSQDEKTTTEKDEKGSAKVDVLSVPTRKGVSKKANKGQNGIEKAPDESLVADSLNRLSEFFNGSYHNAMQQAGDLIIETFYGREPERVIERKPVLKESLLSLIKQLQEGKNKVPSKSWFYNARDLAAHEQIFQKRGFQIFGNLGHSHKLALLPVRDLDKIQALATAAFENKYNVEDLKNEINKGKPSRRINLEEPPTIQTLEELEAKELERLHARASNFVINNRPKLENYEESLKRIDQVIAEKAETEGSKRKKGRFRDWTRPEDNVNFCTGCENDCLYCYMKPMADNRPTWKITSDTWHQMRIRQDDVDAKQKRHAGLVGFPSSHDILPSNIDKALIVLGKLLRAGNEVLIVSKPRIECIKRICEASQFYKDKILFRFTIGAMDNKLLRFWEEHTPIHRDVVHLDVR